VVDLLALAVDVATAVSLLSAPLVLAPLVAKVSLVEIRLKTLSLGFGFVDLLLAPEVDLLADISFEAADEPFEAIDAPFEVVLFITASF